MNDCPKNREYSEILKVLANPDRLCMLRNMIEHGPVTVSGLQECMCTPQSTISQHVAKLRAMGIIKGNRQGRKILYDIDSRIVKNLIDLLYEEPEGNNE